MSGKKKTERCLGCEMLVHCVPLGVSRVKENGCAFTPSKFQPSDTSEAHSARAVDLAARIPQAALDALLDVGTASNELKALPDGEIKETVRLKFRICLSAAVNLGEELAKRLRPQRSI